MDEPENKDEVTAPQEPLEETPAAPDESAPQEAAAPEEPVAQEGPAAPAEASAPEEPPAPLSEADIAAVVEAILFTTDTPMPPGKISQVGELPGVKSVREAVRTLNERYEQVGAAFRIEEIGGGYQMLTQSRFHDVLERLNKARSDSKLSQAALETLAIIAYRQPILRADVEAIRGVASGEVLRGLMEKNLAKIVGRAEVIGRPMLYGTTRRFLEVFGLGSLEDLPRVEELRSGAKEEKKPATENTENAETKTETAAAVAPEDEKKE